MTTRAASKAGSKTTKQSGNRTDIHAPSHPSFDPEAYECYGVWDTHPEWPDLYATKERLEIIRSLIAKGYKSGHGSMSNCGHCGHMIRYAALMVRDDAKQWIYVGQDCLANRFEALTKGEFEALRKAHAAAVKNRARQARKAQAIEDHPILSRLTDPDYVITVPLTDWEDSFLWDIKDRFDRYELTLPQIELVEKTFARIDERIAHEAEKQAQIASGEIGPAPVGEAVEIMGIVAYEPKEKETGFGWQWKMVVELGNGSKVYGTVPSKLLGSIHAGTVVKFIAKKITVDKDPTFGFYSNASKAVIVS